MSRVLVKEEGGSVRISEAALGQIVSGAVSSVGGARLLGRWRRVALELEGGHARAKLDLAVAYGSCVPDVARAVQERVADALAATCDLRIDAVDVRVGELDR